MTVARVVAAVVAWALLLIVACTSEQVTVVTISSVTVVPPNASAVAGDQLQFQASVHDENDQPLSAAVVTWSSADPAVASVDSDGLVVAHAEGSAEIRATFDGVSGSATVRVINPLTPPAGFTLSESGGSTRVTESGGSDGFTAVLTSQPASNVVLDIRSSDAGEVTASPGSLTFTPTTWSTPQTVTVSGVDDTQDDGDQATTVTVSVNDADSDNLFDVLADQTVTVVTVDDDSPPPPPAGFGVSESGGSTRVTEAGGSDSFTAVLTSQPASNVVLNVGSSDTGEVTVSPGSLTFTPSSWSTPQTVTVVGVDDTQDDGDQATTVTVSVNDAASDNIFDPLADRTVTAVTVDDDNPPPPPAGFDVSESGGSTSVSEAGGTDALAIVLTSQPASNVVLDVRSADTGEVTVSPGSLTFTPSSWNTPQPVTVTGVDDTQDDGDQATTVTVSVNDAASDNLFDALADRTVTVTTVDDDDPPPPPPPGIAIVESGSSTRVSETGASDYFTVVLTSRPAANVVLDVRSADTGEVTASPGSLTFTPSSWDTPQTVTLAGVADLLPDGDQVVTVTVAVNDANSDDAYDGLAEQVSVTNVDSGILPG